MRLLNGLRGKSIEFYAEKNKTTIKGKDVRFRTRRVKRILLIIPVLAFRSPGVRANTRAYGVLRQDLINAIQTCSVFIFTNHTGVHKFEHFHVRFKTREKLDKITVCQILSTQLLRVRVISNNCNTYNFIWRMRMFLIVLKN